MKANNERWIQKLLHSLLTLNNIREFLSVPTNEN